MERVLPPEYFVPEGDLDISAVITQLWQMLNRAESAAVGEFGLMIGAVDLDVGSLDLDGVELDENVIQGREGDWSGGGLDLAGKAYKRASGWDFSPGEAGIWLLALIPESGSGTQGDARWSYQGSIVGFVVRDNRDDDGEDGEYEAIGHLWTAGYMASTRDRKAVAVRVEVQVPDQGYRGALHLPWVGVRRSRIRP